MLKNFEGNIFSKKFLRLFHECDFYGFGCEKSKQLEHKKMEML